MALDARDQAFLVQAQASLDKTRHLIQVGHVVQFADGTRRVVSHVWTDEGDKPESIQTSDMTGDARIHLGHFRERASMEYSGGLYCGVPFDTFAQTAENAQVAVWIWHHQISGAGRGVYCNASVPVWACSLMPNSV